MGSGTDSLFERLSRQRQRTRGIGLPAHGPSTPAGPSLEHEHDETERPMTDKLKSGERLPDVTVPQLGGGELRLGVPVDDHDWQMVVVYRGKHCPICKTYLAELERVAPEFERMGSASSPYPVIRKIVPAASQTRSAYRSRLVTT
jgi:hypothetical protein